MRPFDFQSLCTPVGFACTYLYRVAVPLPVCHIGCILSSVPGGLPIAILVRTVTVSADAVSEATSDVSSFNGDCVSLPVFTPLLRRGDTCLLAGCKESYSARDFPVPVPPSLQSIDLGRVPLLGIDCRISTTRISKNELTPSGAHLSAWPVCQTVPLLFLTFYCTWRRFESTFCCRKDANFEMVYAVLKFKKLSSRQ